MYLIFIFLLSLSSFVKTDFDHFALRDDMTLNDEKICQIYQAEVISENEFPKSRLFLTNLIQKYPQEFSNVSFYQVKGFVPFAGMGIIGVPYEWLVMLENEVSIAQKWMEWAFLHEAGHIHHQHVRTMSYLNIGQGISNILIFYSLFLKLHLYFSSKEIISSLSWPKSKKEEKEAEQVNKIANKVLLGSSLASTFFAAALVAYSKYIAEPQADDFAAEKCQDKEALQAAVEWLDGCTTDHPMYPTVEERIEKIENAINSKFNNN